jgi:hypothetical protein
MFVVTTFIESFPSQNFLESYVINLQLGVFFYYNSECEYSMLDDVSRCVQIVIANLFAPVHAHAKCSNNVVMMLCVERFS